MNATRNVIVGTICGIAFFYAIVYSVGVISAIAYPEWVMSIAAKNSNLAFAMWRLVTSVPLVILISFVLGAALSRILESHYFAVGCLSVAITLFLGIVGMSEDLGVARAIRYTFLPVRCLDVPMHLAVYIYLPIAASLMGRRSNAV